MKSHLVWCEDEIAPGRVMEEEEEEEEEQVFITRGDWRAKDNSLSRDGGADQS